MLISEIYSSRQGEGRLTGTPSVFVRTSGCNLRCRFCDTPFASWSPEGETLTVQQIVERVLLESGEPDRSFRHIVLTGGEPMLQRDVEELCLRFNELGFHMTIETAGTIYRDLCCDLMSISPKFANSTPSIEQAGTWRQKHEATRHQPETVRQLMNQYEYQLKFVVDHPDDLVEIRSFLNDLNPHWESNANIKSRVMFMPQGIDLADLQAREVWLKPLCDQWGVVFCPRKHIQWYGNRRGT